jgi:hypothetical protein
MKHAKAFTLRDMVAVVCLAGLTLPLLGASLQGVLNKSLLAKCMLNLNELTRAVNIYADHNRGYMPVYQHHVYSSWGVTGSYVNAPENPWKTYLCFSDLGTPQIDPNTGVFSDVRGLGRLYALKYERRPDLFYCPVVSRSDQRQTLAHYPTPWGTAIAPDSAYIRNSYMWNPWIKQNPASAGHGAYEDGLALRQHPFYRPLICDLVDDGVNIAHFTEDSAVWNMAYPAGQVVPFANQKLYDLMKNGPPPNYTFRSSQNLFWAGSNQSFNTSVRPLLPGANIPGQTH